MCLLALFYRVVDDAPLVAGANREEFYDRPGLPPQLHDLGGCRAVAGTDPRAGGTWFGVNEHGVMIAVTNRRDAPVPANPRSRGLLARDLLTLPSARVAADAAGKELSTGRYAGCNVVCADSDAAIVLHAADWLRVAFLPVGIHVLSNGDVNDPGDERVRYALSWLDGRGYIAGVQCVSALQDLCGQAGGDGPAICLRGEGRGTVSSSILLVRDPISHGTYLHAQGSPDHTPYVDYSYLLRELRR